jgi:hypothetical protein
MQPRRTLAAAVLLGAAMTVGAPYVSRAPLPLRPGSAVAAPVEVPGSVGWSGCGSTNGTQGQGSTGSNHNAVCGGSNVVNVGPSVGSEATVVGPTITSPTFAGQVIVGNGATAVGP